MSQKNVKQYLDALVDQDGFRTEVTITLTDQTLWKIVGGLVLAGAGIALIARIIKNLSGSAHEKEIISLLTEIKNQR